LDIARARPVAQPPELVGCGLDAAFVGRDQQVMARLRRAARKLEPDPRNVSLEHRRHHIPAMPSRRVATDLPVPPWALRST